MMRLINEFEDVEITVEENTLTKDLDCYKIKYRAKNLIIMSKRSLSN